MESKASLVSYALSICDMQAYRDHCRELTLCTVVDAARCNYSGNNPMILLSPRLLSRIFSALTI
jgi:hypothetical protein